MQNIPKRLLIILVFLSIGILLRFLASSKETPLTVSRSVMQPSSALPAAEHETAPVAAEKAPSPPPDGEEQRIKRFTIPLRAGDTLHDVLDSHGVQPQEISRIIACSKKVYNLTRLHAGKSLILTLDQGTKSVERLEYGYDDGHLLIVSKTNGGYSAAQEKLSSHVALRSVRGTITSSLFDDAVRAGCPPPLVVKFADLFAWDIDFFTSVKENDEFKLLFEEVIRENLDIGRPSQVQLIFDRKINKRTPGRFRTRVITDGVVPSLHVDYKHSRIKQYHKEGRALRTEESSLVAEDRLPSQSTSS